MTIPSLPDVTLRTLPPRSILVPYMVFLAISAGVSYFVAAMQISVLLTLANMAQLLALSFLWVASSSPECGDQISIQSLALYVMALCLRLSSSTWLNGYLPVDATGDCFFQVIDMISLALALLLARKAIEESATSATVCRLDPLRCGVPIAFALAVLVRANMNARPVFDTLWTAGHFLSSAASIPQLFIASSGNGTTNLHVTHSLLAAALGQLLVLVYMWICRADVTCDMWVEGVNHAIWFIIAAPLVHLGIVCDVVPYVFSEETV